ncbi:MAG: hypothetical protein ACTHJ0_09540 [Flavipsychrobacter sp.]
MKPIYILFFFLFASESIFGQSFVGLVHDNDAGGMFKNPAYVVNDDNYQIHAAALSFLVGNSGYTVNGNISDNSNLIKNNSRVTKAFWLNMDLQGPAVTFRVKKRFSFGVSTRLRYLMNADNVSDEVFNQIDKTKGDTAHKYVINNFSFNSQMFSELNLTYGGYFISDGDNTLTGGVSAKVLMGFGAAGIGIPHATFNDLGNNTIGAVNGTANIAFTPYANQWLSSFTLGNALQNGINNTGFGLDAGIVYVHTPIDENTGKRDGYDFRAAISITDVGSINYIASSTTGSYSAKINAIQLDTIDKSASTTYGQMLYKYGKDSLIKQTGSKSKFRVGLPTALHINADMKVYNSATVNGWVNFNMLINLRAPSADKYASHYITTFTVTPRALWKEYGLSIPFSFNSYKQGTFGLILYAGPFYIGSSTVGNLLFNNISSMDAFAGLSIRIRSREEKDMVN